MFSLKEYTPEEYERDMRKLLSEKGLHGAVETYADLIESLMHDINAGYLTIATVQEYLCDILYLIDLDKKE